MVRSSDPVEVRVDGPVGTILLDRRDHGNTLTRSMVGELGQALGDLHLEKRVRAVVLTGAGESFCLGRDLDEQQATGDEAADLARWGAEAEELRDLLASMLEFPKPLIAAVNGPAEAVGAALVLGCDVVIASHDARFGFPEPRRGVVAGVAAPLVAYRVGAGTAARLLLTAATIDAPEAHRLAIYHELVKTDLVWARAADVARECARSAPQALQLTKRVLYETIGEQLGTQLTSGAIASATARTTEAAREGLAALREGRPPEWL
ncbi:MAG: enoyl-CoA hydratase/isomerase family protein [Lacipirellulaceae bacterium]